MQCPQIPSAHFAQRGDCNVARVALGHHVRLCVGNEWDSKFYQALCVSGLVLFGLSK